ncbi:hypothetical protein [Deminuibacter soli]|nr:hypothetical protein [Deminuibacter soli]
MRYFFWFWTTTVQLAFYIVRSRRRETARAYALLATIEQQYQGNFNKATRKKIAVSHGIYNPMICDAFTRLHGRLTSDSEKMRLVHYFICSSLFDDFTDYPTISEEQLLQLSFQPEQYHGDSFDEKVFRQSHLLLKEYVHDKAAYENIARQLYKAQLFSRKQSHSSLPEETIREITFTKGGYAVLLCRHYLDVQATAAEDECWYRMGTIIQLTNDLYDIYKDLQEHITTLPGSMTNAYAFELFFLEQVNAMKAAIKALPYPQQRKQTFSLAMAGIYSFGLIALDQLKTLQGNALQLPDLHTLPRKALIVDMEKMANRRKWFAFTYKHARLSAI